MADTTPDNTTHIDILTNEINYLKDEVERKQKGLTRIYRIFDEHGHACKINFTPIGRMEWMQKIAQIASATTVIVNTAVDEPIETTNVEVLKTKKPSKIVGVGMAGEKSGL